MDREEIETLHFIWQKTVRYGEDSLNIVRALLDSIREEQDIFLRDTCAHLYDATRSNLSLLGSIVCKMIESRLKTKSEKLAFANAMLDNIDGKYFDRFEMAKIWKAQGLLYIADFRLYDIEDREELEKYKV